MFLFSIIHLFQTSLLNNCKQFIIPFKMYNCILVYTRLDIIDIMRRNLKLLLSISLHFTSPFQSIARFFQKVV